MSDRTALTTLEAAMRGVERARGEQSRYVYQDWLIVLGDEIERLHKVVKDLAEWAEAQNNAEAAPSGLITAAIENALAALDEPTVGVDDMEITLAGEQQQ